MKNKTNLGSIPFWILTIILGSAIYKQIDFENLSFKHMGMGIIYSVCFLFMIFVLVKGKKVNK